MAFLACVTAGQAVAENDSQGTEPFAIRVVDEDTKRGVPLVQLKATPDQVYLTDSNGYVALDDPTFMNQRVFFHIASHGYEFAKDGFGFRGKALLVKPGGEVILQIKRINIAERLYRITGAGIYRDSVKLRKPTPIQRPLHNGLVAGQDTVQTVVKGDRIHWFWGDTDRLSYPLGQFNTSGATSMLPRGGGLDPATGINLSYFTDKSGFSRPMFKRESGVLIWVHGAFSVAGPDGDPKIVTHFSRRKSLQHQLSHGLAVFNETKNLFEPVVVYDPAEKLYPRGQAFRVEENGVAYVYFADPYAAVRVRANWNDVLDPKRYESFTPLLPGSTDAAPENLDRTAGTLQFGWKKATAPVTAGQLLRWAGQGVIKRRENWWRTVDAETAKPIVLHRGSIHYNPYRNRWIMIAHQTGGVPSFLGEVWYSEAVKPEGPFPHAVKIVTHNGYSFYNVAHHDFFDQQRGRVIYFEGTYTKLFSRSQIPTPWYDYNQIMYRLDLGHPRLTAAFVKEEL